MFWVAIGVVVFFIVVLVIVYNKSTCTSPQVLQNGTCVTPLKCNPPQVLQNNLCVTPPPNCNPPQVLQYGKCVTPPVKCAPPKEMQNGVCVTPTTVTCAPPKEMQNGVCVTPTSGIKKCTPPLVMQNGTCVSCPSDLTEQNGLCVSCKNNSILYLNNCVSIMGVFSEGCDKPSVCVNIMDVLKEDLGRPSLCVSTRRVMSSYYGPCVSVVDSNKQKINIGFDSKGMIDYEAFNKLRKPVFVYVWFDQSGFNNHFRHVYHLDETLFGSSNGMPQLGFVTMPTGLRKPIISFFNGSMASASCGSLGVNNPNHCIISSVSSAYDDVQFIHSSYIKECNEMHLNGSAGIRVIMDTNYYLVQGAINQYTDGKYHTFANRGGNPATGDHDIIYADDININSLFSRRKDTNKNYAFVIGERKGGDATNKFYLKGDISEFIIFPTTSAFSNNLVSSIKLYMQNVKVYNDFGYLP